MGNIGKKNTYWTEYFLLFSLLRTQMLFLCTQNYLLKCWATEEFWTSVWKLFWVCHNKWDIVSAMQLPNTNSAKVTVMWRKLRKARKLSVTRHSSNVNQSTLKRMQYEDKFLLFSVSISILAILFLYLVPAFIFLYLVPQIYTFIIYL